MATTEAATPPTSRTAGLEARIEDLERKSEALEYRLNFLRDAEKTITIDPAGNPAFQRLRTSYGDFFVTLEGVEPYLDGIRVRLKVGNPTSADFNGFDLQVTWGERQPDLSGDNAVPKWKRWRGEMRTKDCPFTNILTSGTWNKVSFILPATEPEQFGHLELSMSIRAIRMDSDSPN